jgi:hypothetical protein
MKFFSKKKIIFSSKKNIFSSKKIYFPQKKLVEAKISSLKLRNNRLQKSDPFLE